MRRVFISAVCLAFFIPLVGCIVERTGGGAEPDAGGEVVEVEPAPVERVYVYERGYPPGTYFYDGWYYYRGRRWERDVFVTRVVNVNIRRNRFVDVERNRREGRRIEETHRTEYAHRATSNSRAQNSAGTGRNSKKKNN